MVSRYERRGVGAPSSAARYSSRLSARHPPPRRWSSCAANIRRSTNSRSGSAPGGVAEVVVHQHPGRVPAAARGGRDRARRDAAPADRRHASGTVEHRTHTRSTCAAVSVGDSGSDRMRSRRGLGDRQRLAGVRGERGLAVAGHGIVHAPADARARPAPPWPRRGPGPARRRGGGPAPRPGARPPARTTPAAPRGSARRARGPRPVGRVQRAPASRRSTAACSVSSRLLRPDTSCTYRSHRDRPWSASRRIRSTSAASSDTTAPPSPRAPRFLPG